MILQGAAIKGKERRIPLQRIGVKLREVNAPNAIYLVRKMINFFTQKGEVLVAPFYHAIALAKAEALRRRRIIPHRKRGGI